MTFIVALIVGAGVAVLAMWMRNKGVAIKWYDWVIGIVGFLTLLFAMQNFFASGIEGEPAAASNYLLIVGLPSLVLLVVAGSLIWRRHSAAA